MKKIALPFVLAFAASTAFALPAVAEDVTLEQVPAKVKEAIQKEVKDGKISEIERDKDDGIVVYEVEYRTAKGEKFEMKLGEDGKVLSNKPD